MTMRRYKKWKEEDHFINESINIGSGGKAASGFSLVWSKKHLKYHKFKIKAGLFNIHAYMEQISEGGRDLKTLS